MKVSQIDSDIAAVHFRIRLNQFPPSLTLYWQSQTVYYVFLLLNRMWISLAAGYRQPKLWHADETRTQHKLISAVNKSSTISHVQRNIEPAREHEVFYLVCRYNEIISQSEPVRKYVEVGIVV